MDPIIQLLVNPVCRTLKLEIFIDMICILEDYSLPGQKAG